MSRFDGKVALVTGAASGVGRATAERFCRDGGKVYGLDIDEAGLQGLGDQLGGAFAGDACDISSRDQSHAAVSAAVAKFGRLDLVANVAGIGKSHHMVDVSEEDWRRMLGVNLDGTFWISQAAIPHLLETGGSIVNVASNAGLMGQAYTVPYCATKGAVVNMTKAMAMEFVKTNIRINAVAPGGMVTGLTSNYSMPDDVDFELMMPYTGFRGMAEADTCANAICWLASEEAERCNGTILSIDGGLTAG